MREKNHKASQTIYWVNKQWTNTLVALIIILSLLIVFPTQGVAKGTIQSTNATTRYVAPNGNDSGSCTSPSNPCRTIQYAVNQSISGDTILVAAGTYTYEPSVDKCSFLITRAVVCFVDKHLSIKGGYSGGNWSYSDPVNFLTIIDGYNQYRGVAIIAYNSTASLTMDGFTIQNGMARGVAGRDMWAASGRGGGIWSQGGTIVLSSMIFKNNKAIGADTNVVGGDGSGGAIMIESVRDKSISYLDNIVFEGNQAKGGIGYPRGGVALGGALFVYESSVTGQDLIFRENIVEAGDTTGFGEANQLRADGLGGAISLQSNSIGVFTRVSAYSNSVVGGDAAEFGGGGFGGAIHIEDSNLRIENSELKANFAKGGKGNVGGYAMGGGLMTDDSLLTMSRGIVIQNQAIAGETLGASTPTCAGGGGLYLTAFTQPNKFVLNLSNTIVADNVIDVEGQGIKTGGSGAGVVVQALTANLNHITLANNQVNNDARFGQALMIVGLKANDNTGAIVNLQNSIVSDHINPFTSSTSAITVVPGSTLHINQVLFANNINDINTNSQPIDPGVITGLDKIFKETTVGFVSLGYPNYDYHLLPSSPAVDKAQQELTDIDFENDGRPYNGRSDLGADEYVPIKLMTVPEILTGITDRTTPLCFIVTILTTGKVNALWSARTNETWISLGDSLNSSEATGGVGQNMTVCVLPNGLYTGWHEGQVNISSPEVESTTLYVKVQVVEKLNHVYLPLTLKHP